MESTLTPPQPEASFRPHVSDTRVAAVLALLALVVAATALGLWLWSHVCAFPGIVWNDIRLAPTIAAARGLDVYPSATSGTINTWMYGPLPILYYWPASWAPGPGSALMVAALLNTALFLVPVALVSFLWPAWNEAADSALARAAAFVLSVALWPERHYEVIFADNLAIACGLLGSLVLVRARRPAAFWVAAVLATSAVACKQITVGIPLAHLVWLGATQGRRALLAHAFRCAIVAISLGAALVGFFGHAGLWFMWWLPAGLPWNVDLARLQPAVAEAAVQVMVPALALVAGRRTFLRPIALLPTLVWACTVPTGLLALAKIGGWLNSFHSLALWLPAALTLLLTSRWPQRAARMAPLAASVCAAAIACARILQAPRLTLRPATAHYRQATDLAARLPEQIWFPFHPVVTLYSDNRYYHDEDGFYVRQMARQPPSPRQVAAHVPRNLRVIAFHTAWNDWGIAKSMLPANAQATLVGPWALWASPAATDSR